MTHPTWTRRRALQSTAAAAAGSMAWGPSWAQDAKEIRIGQSCHLTGPLAPTLLLPLKGQQLAFEEVNKKGGIGGKPVRLITLDDAYDPKKAAENTAKLIDEEKCVALFGYASTANVAAVLPMLAEKKVPLIGAYGGSPMLRVKQHPYFFTTMASYRDEVVRDPQPRDHAEDPDRRDLPEPCLRPADAAGGGGGRQGTGRHHRRQAVARSERRGCRGVAQGPRGLEAAGRAAAGFGPSTVPVIKALRTTWGAGVRAVHRQREAARGALGEDGRGMAYADHSVPVAPDQRRHARLQRRDEDREHRRRLRPLLRLPERARAPGGPASRGGEARPWRPRA